MEDCKGCLSQSNCINLSINKTNCPCKICITKVVCKNICYQYYDYVLTQNGYSNTPYMRCGISVVRSITSSTGQTYHRTWDQEDTRKLRGK